MVLLHTKLFVVLIFLLLTFSIMQLKILDYEEDKLINEKLILSRLSHKITSKCKSLEINFTKSEILSLWNYKNYSFCPKSDSFVDWNNLTLQVNCKRGDPLFHTDHNFIQRLGGEALDVIWTKSFVMQPKSEYFIVKCSNNIDDHFVFFLNKFNPEVSQRALNISNRNQISKNKFSVLFLLFDSVSRYSAYMNWPLSMNYLNNLNSSFEFFDFSSPAASGVQTRQNMVPIIYGHSEEYQDIYLKDATYDTRWPSARYLSLQKSSIWSYYSGLGYTTMFLYDTVFDFMVKSYGRDIVADHVFVNFWKTALKVFGFHDFSKKQRCLGSKDSHYYSLDYTSQYLKNYRFNNRFAYVHLDAAHENTGNVRTVDKDLLAFFKDIFEWYKENNQDFVIFLLGDHGRINPNLQFNIKGYLDQRTPMTFLINSQGVTKALKNKEILNFNKKELLGRYDINLSLKDIAYFPYTQMSESEYNPLKKTYPVKDVVSIFREKIAENRNCLDIGVEELHCTCKDYREIDEENSEDMKIANEIFELGKKFVKRLEGELGGCKKIREFQFSHAEKYQLMPVDRGWDSIFKVIFKADGMVVRVVGNFCTWEKIELTKNILPKDLYPVSRFRLNETEVFSQVIEMKIKSDCESDYCICKKQY